MKKILLLLMTVATSVAGFGQHTDRTISGIVYAKDDSLPLPGVSVKIVGTRTGAYTGPNGKYTLSNVTDSTTIAFSFLGFDQLTVKVGNKSKIDVYLVSSSKQLNEVIVSAGGLSVVRGYAARPRSKAPPFAISKFNAPQNANKLLKGKVGGLAPVDKSLPRLATAVNDEEYGEIRDNAFLNPLDLPLSTFSVDVDNAAYSNVRRFINDGELPPKDAVRIEEMINYFKYQLPKPKGDEPVAITTGLTAAPWNPTHRLLRIGLQAKTIPSDKLPASNLVFLIDVSGSMEGPGRLPLVKEAMKLLVHQLRQQDKVAIVVYAGNAGLVLPATPGDQKEKIIAALDELDAGGSTAGGEGIKLAYKIARENFRKGGNNRVVLATDGDFNVGASSDQSMEELITKERKSGVDLSVLGFGMGNYKDSKMEKLADKGNGNYAYIDNMSEAQRALVTEFGGTMFTVAKDVKLQIEFNPAKVQAYRLIGYENRLLAKEDFNDDKKDAGDMGSGHAVTALYEIIPAGIKDEYVGKVDPLKYQKVERKAATSTSDEMLTVKFRYKAPQGSVSKMSQVVVKDTPVDFDKQPADLRFAAAVAEVGMLLRDSEFKGKATYDQAIKIAEAAKANDEEGYRSEFIRLAKTMRSLSKSELAQK